MEDQELKRAITNLTNYEKKLSSLRWAFFRGIIYGLGFFIGSAILAAVLILIMSRINTNSFFGKAIKNVVDVIEEQR